MTHKVAWFIKDKVILGQVWGDNDISDLEAYNASVNALLDESAGDQIYLVFDGIRTKGMPPLSAFKAFTFPKHPKFKYAIVLQSSNRFLNFIASATTQIFKTRTFFANNYDEVMLFLHDLLPDLPELESYRYLLEEDPTVEA